MTPAEPLSSAGLAALAGRLRGARVLVVGDVMLDHYLVGDAARISPEAPVPVVRVARERRALGGAGNVARNLSALDASVTLLGVTGEDDPGRAVHELMARESLPGFMIVEKGRLTTIKTRILAGGQQMLRVDREETGELRPATRAGLVEALRNECALHDVVIVSDYGKGVVCREIMEALAQARAERAGGLRVLVDPKVVNAGLYTGVDLLTPNAKEAGELGGVDAAGREGVIRAGLAIFRRLRCRQLCITLGAQGMAVFEAPGKVLHVPTVARTVFDVTGAGDTVIAVLAMALGSGIGLAQASLLANCAAGVVVAQVGAAVTNLEELGRALAGTPPPVLEQWLDLD
ncbi:D-beta-D-heptose 7-phosphate kinase [Fundidesulfovibrio magnetotacticus]|uniref:D-beta-D-heptose 7-phosphate kinase n=1 Tax=Fundidesulfovibrio magnetotacticus TaxID=2730080 RepID=A0A6V8LWU1_9BACT|nr:bifunctional ADP-heptose synthase [Fundidesulfovibrio magnetotacticus]GFK95360.1 D-beta-D-heptose 7-phosphate kinase [Fundidesulfovibrio magnetotacticus]